MNHWPECININIMDNCWDQEIQICSYEVLGVKKGHALRGHVII